MVSFFFFFLKNFPWLCAHHLQWCQRRWGEFGVTIWVNISENCKPVPRGRVILRRCSCCLGPVVWSWAPRSVQVTGSPVSCWRSKQATFLETWAWRCWGVSVYTIGTKALRTWAGGKMWRAVNAPSCQSQRFQSPHLNNDLSSTHVFKRLRPWREPAWIRAEWAFDSIVWTCTLSVTLTGVGRILLGVTVVCDPPELNLNQYLIL